MIDRSFANLTSINVSDNSLTSLPSEFVRYKYLKQFTAQRNRFSSFPSVLCVMSVEVVDFSDNEIISIPHSISEMSRLIHLDLSRNKLSFLPPEIGFMPKLKGISVVGNPLTSLPPSLGSDPNFGGLLISDLLSLSLSPSLPVSALFFLFIFLSPEFRPDGSLANDRSERYEVGESESNGDRESRSKNGIHPWTLLVVTFFLLLLPLPAFRSGNS